MKSIFILPIFICTVFSNVVYAQVFSISGKIVTSADAKGIIVNLVKANDSSIYKTVLCDNEGAFSFEFVKKGSYKVNVSNSNFDLYFSNAIEIVNNNIILAPIKLNNIAQSLTTVKVTATKNFVEQKIDRVVINPDALISNAGTNALDVLEKSPGVLVDVNGNISLKGKQGVVIFIDDKPTYLAAADVANYLRTLSSNTLESIELMTNPPAKYDAAGNAGIINIRLKKTKVLGFNGGINVAIGQGSYFRTNNSINFNYRINKVNVFTNMSYNDVNTYQDLTINRFYYDNNGILNSTFNQNSFIKKGQTSFNARVGADFYVTPKTTLGIAVSGFTNPATGNVLNNAKVLDNNTQPTALIKATNPSNKKWNNTSVNANYSYKFNNKGKELTGNVDYINYTSTVTQNLINSSFDPNNVFINSTTLASSLPATINIASAKFDYVHPINSNAKVETGLKASKVTSKNIADFFDVLAGTSIPNYSFSNKFNYNENINAVYFNVSKEQKLLSLQAGVRIENTQISGKQFGNPTMMDSSFKRNYTNVFPTLFIQYKLDTVQKNQMAFSFGRRINRPNYQDLNPFTYPLDRFTFYGGNPFLQPTIAFTAAVSHTYKNKITTTIDYSVANNLIQETNEQRGNIYYSRPGNFGKQVVYGIDVNATLPITKWWTLQLYAAYKNMQYKSVVYGQILDDHRFYGYIAPTNQFVITKNLSAELAGSYQTKILVAQFLTIPVWQARVGLSQKILKGKGALRINVSDLFFTNQPGGDIRNIANSKANWVSVLDSRVVTIGFSYRFNKGKTLNLRKTGAADDEKGRVKTS
ncbi:outer membrane beta-barrel protein [Ferruginibacter yonginensis]|uniref:Outer membrane beta-barrel protein n=1 Tax=Ferruginibacter yonginensis TaxID=1310416 RepID=A0ABV8QR15_9BACT